MITTTIISTTTSLSTRKASQREQQLPHMTSLEVAEICGKRHNDIMRAIRKKYHCANLRNHPEK